MAKTVLFAEKKELKVLPWFTDIISPNKTTKKIVVNKQIGWLKIAFCYAFHFLQNEVGYEEAITEMLVKGGDTDTNACIVGGLLGAHLGKTGLPQTMYQDFMDEEKIKRMRKNSRLVERELIAQEHAEKYAERLIAMAPTKLEVE